MDISDKCNFKSMNNSKKRDKVIIVQFTVKSLVRINLKNLLHHVKDDCKSVFQSFEKIFVIISDRF